VISLFSKEARQEQGPHSPKRSDISLLQRGQTGIGPTQPKEKRYFSSPKRPDRNRDHTDQGEEIFLFSKEARQGKGPPSSRKRDISLLQRGQTGIGPKQPKEKRYFSSPKMPDRNRANPAQGKEIFLFSKAVRQEQGPHSPKRSDISLLQRGQTGKGTTQPKEKRYFSSPKRPDRNRAHPAQGKEIFLFSKEARQE